jgi:RsiW-degrading membrane proteinase PrsW (M82 family)
MEATDRCCVCQNPATHHFGGRPYCDDDYARATRPNTSLVRTLVIMVAGLLVFSLAVWGLAQVLINQDIHLSRTVLFGAGIVLALVPAGLWLWFFYSQDRLEPEPRGFVLAVFMLAAVLEDFLAERVFDVFELGQWLPASSAALVLGSILVKGIMFSLIVWAVIRFTVFPTREFDERMDGIVYGTAAGLGIATMLNLNYVLDSGGVLLGPGVINIIVTTLAQASFGGLIGYFLGEANFIDEPVWWMPLGIGLASVLNGAFLALSVLVKASGTGVNVILALVLAAVVAVLTFAGLMYLMRRAIAATLRAEPVQ